MQTKVMVLGSNFSLAFYRALEEGLAASLPKSNLLGINDRQLTISLGPTMLRIR